MNEHCTGRLLLYLHWVLLTVRPCYMVGLPRSCYSAYLCAMIVCGVDENGLWYLIELAIVDLWSITCNRGLCYDMHF